MDIVSRPELKNLIDKYPVATIMHVLYAGSPSKQDKLRDYAPDSADKIEIEKLTGKMNKSNDRTEFLMLLEKSWDAHNTLHPTIPLADRQKLTLTNTFESMDNSWYAKLPEWVQWEDKL